MLTTYYQFPLYAAPDAVQVARDNAEADLEEAGAAAGGDEEMESD